MIKLKTMYDSPWFKPIRNAGTLSIGRMAQGFFSLAYTALAARALGLENFGALVLIHSFILAVSQFARFQSQQFVQRFGAQALHQKSTKRFQNVLVFALLLDLASILMALVIIMAAIGPATGLLGLSNEAATLAWYYGFGVVFVNMASTANGVLSLLDRFDLLSAQTAVEPALRLIGSIILFLLSADLTAFLLLWFLSLAAGKIVLSFLSLRELQRKEMLKGFKFSTAVLKTPEPGAWRFAFGTNFSSTLGLAETQLPILAVGWLLGPAGAGLFKGAQQIANVLTKPTSKLLVPAIYPELAHLNASDDHEGRRHMATRTVLLAGGAALSLLTLLVVFGKPIIHLIFGTDYIAAYPVMVFLALAGVIEVTVFSLEPLLVSAGHIRAIIIVRSITTATYTLLLYVLTTGFGLIGAGFATAAKSALIGILMFIAARSMLTKTSILDPSLPSKKQSEN